ncbi:MAG: hypothetical protein WCS42_24800, partial [Verrucomicrobiota bacterium]
MPPRFTLLRVNKDLYYAPVFFINGSIKGTDLFYRHTTKSFVPLNERWVEYLISLSETAEGHGVPISERTNTRRQLNLQSIVSPPTVMNMKSAAHPLDKYMDAGDAPHDAPVRPANVPRGENMYRPFTITDPEELKKLAAAGWDEIKDAALTELPGGSILRKFIVNDGGFNAITKLANAAKEDPEFAEAMFRSSSPDSYMPELEAYKGPAAPEPVLTLHLQAHKNARVKSASAEDLNKGYVFEDLRPKEALNEAVFEAADRE